MSVQRLRKRFAVSSTVIAVCLGLILTSESEAQTNTGAIVGTVSDITGAVLAGANVTITHTELRVVTEVTRGFSLKGLLLREVASGQLNRSHIWAGGATL